MLFLPHMESSGLNCFILSYQWAEECVLKISHWKKLKQGEEILIVF